MNVFNRLTQRETDAAAALEEQGASPASVKETPGRKETSRIPSRSIGDSIPYEILKYIPEESARHYGFVPLSVSEGVLEVGILNPDNIEGLDALNFISARTNLPFKVFLITETDFNKVLDMYSGLGGEVSEALTELESESAKEDSLEKTLAEVEKKARSSKDGGNDSFIKEDAPVTKIVATVLRYAVEGNASDIHIENVGEKVRVRFRVDGVLYTSLSLPQNVHRAVVARIKILSSMRLDEQRKPQDGRFSATILGRKIDFRVSTFPAHFGEKVVMRILDRGAGSITLEDVGLNEENIALIREALKRPYGLILLSGPTGSGKTTTLYAMLREVDREKKNVLSLEDPVEYNIEGMSQSQVHPEIGYTFATGLRSVLRQDPDVIMVGEIRDKETAQLAVQAALTGHLVFSTIHTNNAIGVIPRLLDMGVDPFLIPPTLVLAIAQRLVRRLCDGTGKPVPYEGSMKAMVEGELSTLPEEFRKKVKLGKELYDIEPSQTCPKGTRGRIGVFEVLTMNKEIEAAILHDPDENKIYDIARKNGMLTMKEDAIMKAFEKKIPFEEINTLGGQLSTEQVT